MSYATLLTNHTPFAAEKFVLIDGEGQEQVLIVLGATFDGSSGQGLELASEQPPPLVEDTYSGSPDASSLLAENELALQKPRVDVVVIGTAHAPSGRPAQRVTVGLLLGPLRKALWVTGDRTRWDRSERDAEPFVHMPIVYERAYGGTRPDGSSLRTNPVGIGFRGGDPSGVAGAGEIPNVEYPDQDWISPPDVTPAGFGPIARWWQPRVGLAGTYDDEWQQNRWPLLPRDFNLAFNQIAPGDQQLAAVHGHEPVRLMNLTPEGTWDFRLPRLAVPVHLLYQRSYAQASLKVDTLVIEPDRRRLRMTARINIRTRRGGDALREVVLGEVTRGWMDSVQKRKRYLDWSGRRGAAPHAQFFTL